ncbi:MAG: type II toxin-antitoxin system VapC family toxin [Nitrospinae bacterium]|nr:type II toxin-antitoxin system VapC family toxin [Nitrospinota bacterium]
MIFLDTSALVKRYIDEPGSDSVESIFGSGEELAVSILAYAEALAALTRRKKAGDLAANALKEAVKSLEADWKRMAVMPLGAHLLPLTKRTINRHNLRGADAVHLASAIFLSQSTGNAIVFAASDMELLAAAKKERLTVLDPQEM